MRDLGNIDHAYLRGQSGGEPANIRALITRLIQRARSGARSVREIDDVVNTQWVRGRPFVIRSQERTQLIGMPPQQRSRYIHRNRGMEVCRTLKGLFYFDPEIEGVPISGDAEDLARTNMKEAVCRHIAETANLAHAYSRVIDLDNVRGQGWIKVGWDPSSGRRVNRYAAIPCPTCAGSGLLQQPAGIAACWHCAAQGLLPSPYGHRGAGVVQQYEGTRPEGDVRFEVLSLSDLYWDPEAPSFDVAMEVVHVFKMPRALAQLRWGRFAGFREGDFVPGSGDVTGGSGAMMTLAGPYYQTSPDREYVYGAEYYQRRSDEYPDGLFGVLLGDHLVWGGKLPYDHETEDVPIFAFPMYEFEGEQFPVSTMDLVLPLIQALSDNLTTKQARARMDARFRFMVPRGALFNVSNKDGHFYYSRVAGGEKPTELRHSAAANTTNELLEFFDRAINDLAGATDVISGKYSASSLGNTKAMAFLEDRAAGPFRPIMSHHARMLDRIIKYASDVAGVHYDDGRLLRMRGATGAIEVQAFRSEALPSSMDVRIKVVQNPGRSQAILIGQAEEALKLGAITAEEYRRVGDFGSLGPLTDDVRPHQNHAIQENRILNETGQMPPPLQYQNHREHIRIHVQQAMLYQQADPNHPLLPAMYEHLQATEEIMAYEQVKVQMMQQQAMAAYGAAEQAAPQNHSPEARSQAEASGQLPTEPFNAAPAPPGGQLSYQQASESAAAPMQQAQMMGG